MSQFRSNAELNEEITRGGTRFRFDGAKWKRLGQNFDATSIASDVAAVLGDTQTYVGHLETVEDKTYHLDAKIPYGRTFVEFFGVAASGTCDASLVSGGVSMGILSVSSSGTTASLSNNTIVAGASLDMVVSGNNSCTDYRFVVGFTQ